jgi:hypothetical protein
MSGIEKNIRSISERVKTNSSSMATEEARKTAVVLPFLRALGYDVFDQNEVIHEFTDDAVGKKVITHAVFPADFRLLRFGV